VAGHQDSIAEIANRLDGKLREEIDAAVDGSPEVRIIRFTPALTNDEPELITTRTLAS
jgi:hypothetical protein